MTDDFTDHPKSITELRADKSQHAADWKPRDVLIDILRMIDSGELDADALERDEPGALKIANRSHT